MWIQGTTVWSLSGEHWWSSGSALPSEPVAGSYPVVQKWNFENIVRKLKSSKACIVYYCA